jgi:IS605 OrfB family transposase
MFGNKPDPNSFTLTTKIKLRNLSYEGFQYWATMCYSCARLYNVCIHATYELNKTKNSLFVQGDKEYLDAVTSNENFHYLPKAASQQILNSIGPIFRSFVGLLRAKGKGTYDKPVSRPSYKDKNGYSNFTVSTNGFQIKNDKLQITPSFGKKAKLKESDYVFEVPKYLHDKKIVMLTVKPSHETNVRYFTLLVTYRVDKPQIPHNYNNVLSIDIGVNNLATCFNSSSNESFIIDGRRLKFINSRYNKDIARLASIKDRQKIKSWTNQMYKITEKRSDRINDIMHKVSKQIIEYCLINDIGTIVIGKNKEWKQKCKLRKSTTQNFVQIPHARLIDMITYKGNFLGIEVVLLNESHTSKCSSLDNEKICHHETYVGKRVKRGLFVSTKGIKINADVNAAINIFRRHVTVKGSSIEIDHEQMKGILAYPLKIKVA